MNRPWLFCCMERCADLLYTVFFFMQWMTMNQNRKNSRSWTVTSITAKQSSSFVPTPEWRYPGLSFARFEKTCLLLIWMHGRFSTFHSLSSAAPKRQLFNGRVWIKPPPTAAVADLAERIGHGRAGRKKFYVILHTIGSEAINGCTSAVDCSLRRVIIR